MDLELSEEQQMIADMTRSLLQEHSTVEVAREMEDDPKGYPDALWKQFSELGLNGILIPESRGGGGMSLFEAALVYEELGRAMSPVPKLLVMMITVLRKSTVLPCPSVRRPSSIICNRMLNTSGWAFSISSNKTTR